MTVIVIVVAVIVLSNPTLNTHSLTPRIQQYSTGRRVQPLLVAYT